MAAMNISWRVTLCAQSAIAALQGSIMSSNTSDQRSLVVKPFADLADAALRMVIAA
jgi:hypothetical protein